MSAAIGQRPRNYLSCCWCCSPFGSFPLYKKFKWKKISLTGNWTRALQIHSQALIHWATGPFMLLQWKIDYYISPQTLDQYWSTLVLLKKTKITKVFLLFCLSEQGKHYLEIHQQYSQFRPNHILLKKWFIQNLNFELQSIILEDFENWQVTIWWELICFVFILWQIIVVIGWEI